MVGVRFTTAKRDVRNGVTSLNHGDLLGALKAHSGVMQAHPGALELLPRAWRLILESWGLTLEHCRLTMKP